MVLSTWACEKLSYWMINICCLNLKEVLFSLGLYTWPVCSYKQISFHKSNMNEWFISIIKSSRTSPSQHQLWLSHFVISQLPLNEMRWNTHRFPFLLQYSLMTSSSIGVTSIIYHLVISGNVSYLFLGIMTKFRTKKVIFIDIFPLFQNFPVLNFNYFLCVLGICAKSKLRWQALGLIGVNLTGHFLIVFG